MVMLTTLGIMLIVELKRKLVDIHDRHYMYMYNGHDVYQRNHTRKILNRFCFKNHNLHALVALF